MTPLSLRGFPVYGEGEQLAWDMSLYTSPDEQQAGWPRLLTVAHAMAEHRPDQFANELRGILRATLGVFSPGVWRSALIAVVQAQPEASAAALGAPCSDVEALTLWLALPELTE